MAFNLVQASMVYVAGATWDRWLPGLAAWQTDELFGMEGGAVFGYLVITFIYYWWHRARHEVALFWRVFHQIHHSPQRIEIITSFYKHPAEIVVNSLLSSLVLYALCGLSPESATLAVLLTGLAELFYHWNVRTPYWLGFFVQRPESHCIHHRKGWHRQNYSDLPLWDILFGTFNNPRQFNDACGFEADLEQKVGTMLLGADVHDGSAKGRRQ
ncbi:sterol desaturase family protein [Nisaea sediminum]|uniref:sterol desaturase family protein n=1 Tax=Nisaea sediminum TaxID=2775867 RepID=UPI001869307B|nr:sterol desaturase family protein [Nisaea sediminum]